MPPKKHKKVIASSGPSTQGVVGPKHLEAIIASDDEFEHLAVEAEERYRFNHIFLRQFSDLIFFFFDSVDKDVIEIGNEDDDELALISHSSTSFPINASLVFFYVYYYFLVYLRLYFQIKKKVILTTKDKKIIVFPRFVLQVCFSLIRY
jgi:hypothetical protein